jgi:hypothetical protein
MTDTSRRPRAEQVRDLIMLCVLVLWIVYGAGAVIQLFIDGAKVLESLPPFWFWGLPLGPYTALYVPWRPPGGGGQAEPPSAPAAPAAPGGGQ